MEALVLVLAARLRRNLSHTLKIWAPALLPKGLHWHMWHTSRLLVMTVVWPPTLPPLVALRGSGSPPLLP